MTRNLTLFGIVLIILLALVGMARATLQPLSSSSTWGVEWPKIESNFNYLDANKVNGDIRIYDQASAPATCGVGDIWVDSDGTSGQRLYACESANSWALQGGAGEGGGITHATSDGNYYASKDGSWSSLAGIYQASDADLTELASPTNWRVFYSNGSGGITPLALGSSGTFLRSNGSANAPTWDTPASAAMVYPDAGVPASTGAAWGTSYTVGAGASNLVQLDSSGRLPAVSAANLTNFPTLNQNTTGTAAALTTNPSDCSAGQYATTIAANGNLTCSQVAYSQISGTPTVSDTAYGVGWNGDTGAASKNAIYDKIESFPTLAAGTGITITTDGGGAGIDTIGVTSSTYQGLDSDLTDLADGSLTASKVQGYAATTVSKATTYTIGTDSPSEAYGGTVYVTSAATVTAPGVATGMNFTVVTIGAIAVSLDVNAADKMILDGVTLADGDKATNTSTSGDTITCQYYSADGWFCWSGTMHATTKHWADGN